MTNLQCYACISIYGHVRNVRMLKYDDVIIFHASPSTCALVCCIVATLEL